MSCHFMSVQSRAASEHHGNRKSVQRFSSTRLLGLTHFPKVKLHRRLSSVLCALIYCLSFCLFLSHTNCPFIFSQCIFFSIIIFFYSSRFWPFSFSLCIPCSSSSLSILTRHLFWPYMWVIWLCSLNLFLNTFFILTSTVLVWGEENRVLYGIHAECKEKNHSVKTHWPNPKRQADRTELWNGTKPCRPKATVHLEDMSLG